MLWLRLLSSPPRSSRCIEFGEAIDIDIRPRSGALPLPLFRGVLTRPSASPVMIFCRFFSFLARASCSSSLRSASSSFAASSSSESVPSDDDGEVGPRCVKLFLTGPWIVTVEDDALLVSRDEAPPRELRRARTPSGVAAIRMNEDSPRVLPTILLEAWCGKVGVSWMKGNSSDGLVVVEGLRAPLAVMSCSPRRSSSYRVCARYRR